MRGFRGSALLAPAWALILILAAPVVMAGPSENVIFHANLDEHSEYNDIWGYTAPNGSRAGVVDRRRAMGLLFSRVQPLPPLLCLP